MINDQQRTGFMEVLSHFYNTRFIQRLVDLKHKELLEQLDAMLQSALREQYQDYITVIADTFNQCVRKQMSPKHMDLLFWQSLTPEAMHKLPAKPYSESFKTAVPFIHAELYELCSRHKIPTIKLFNEDYTLITEAIKEGINKSQKGYFAPVDSVQTQLQEANKTIRKLKTKLKSQKDLIDTLEAQVQEYEKLIQQQSNMTLPTPKSRATRKQTTKVSSEQSQPSIVHTDINYHNAADPKNETDHQQQAIEEAALIPANPSKTKRTRQQNQSTTKRSAVTDVSYLNGQAQLTL